MVLMKSWDLLNSVFTVESLMTRLDDFDTYIMNDDGKIEIDPNQKYDVKPVEHEQKIIGLVEKGTTDLQSLTDRWLITSNTPIPELLRLFVETRQAAFLVFSKQQVIGLVTPADLNRMPARAYVYHVIGELEMGLAELISEKYNSNSSSLFSLLSRTRKGDLADLQTELIGGNADVDLLQVLYLADLITIVEKEATLRSQIGITSRQRAEKMFSGLNELRMQAMHLVKPLLSEIPQDLTTLQDRLERAKQIIEQLDAREGN